MCGIVGFNWDDEKLLKKMVKIVEHRGPDESGYYLDNGISLGHRRLSVIDLFTGQQPIHNEDESIWIVFNGEIYNFKELRMLLEEKKHRFYTSSDTEVIIHLYEELGEDCVKKLNGMFAFAIWDSNKKKLLLARDRLGIKPLYYYINEKKFIFASEIKAILGFEEVKRDIDLNALTEFLIYRYVPGSRTMIKNIYKLLPGHILILKNNAFQIHKYWDLKENISNESEEKYAKKLKVLLEESIKKRLISDVPLGVFLSGGIDSSCVVGLMSKMSEDIKTFSVGFGPEVENELSYARFISEYFDTDHYEINVEEKDLSLLPKMIWNLDEPIGDAATLPTYIISTFAKKKVTVVLAGEGGDELFAGYDNYKIMMWGRNFSKLVPNFLKYDFFPIINKRFYNFSNLKRILDFISAKQEYKQYSSVISMFNDYEMKKLGNFENENEIIKNFFSNNQMTFLNKLLYFSIKTKLVNDYLMKADKMTMANAVEERVPILDHNIVEFSFTVPTTLKLKGLTGKYIMKKAMQDVLPKQIINRKKRGYNAPMDYWFKHSLKDFLEQLLDNSSHNYYNKEYVLGELKKFQKSGNNYNLNFYNAQKLWSVLVFEMWYRIFIDTDKSYKLNLNLNKLF